MTQAAPELDDVLAGRVRAGEPEAFRDLYERHREAVWRCAREYAPHDADDLAAEAFTRILQQLRDGGGPETSFRAYARTVVRRLAAERGRRAGREEAVAELPEQRDPRDEASGAIDREQIRRAFGKLPDRWQRALWLTEVEGCGPEDLGAALNVAPGAASSLAHRAREGLREAYLLVHVGARTPRRCRSTIERLPAYVRGSLTPGHTVRVREHLDDCAFCRTRLFELKELDRDLRGFLLPVLLGGTAIAPAFFGGAIVGRIRDLFSNSPAASTGMAAASVAVVAAAGIAVAQVQGGEASSRAALARPAAPAAQTERHPAIRPASPSPSPRANRSASPPLPPLVAPPPVSPMTTPSHEETRPQKPKSKQTPKPKASTPKKKKPKPSSSAHIEQKPRHKTKHRKHKLKDPHSLTGDTRPGKPTKPRHEKPSGHTTLPNPTDPSGEPSQVPPQEPDPKPTHKPTHQPTHEPGHKPGHCGALICIRIHIGHHERYVGDHDGGAERGGTMADRRSQHRGAGHAEPRRKPADVGRVGGARR